MVRSILNTGFNTADSGLKNNFFKNSQKITPKKSLFVNSLDSISFSKNIKELNYLTSKSMVEKGMEKFLDIKILIEKKYNNSVNFGKNFINYSKKFAIINFKKNIWSIKKRLKPSLAEELAKKPVSELEEMLVISLKKIA